MRLASKIKNALTLWLCAMVVTLSFAETCVGKNLEAPQLESEQIQFTTQASIGENYDASQYDASDYAVAAKGLPPLRQQYIDEVVGLKDLGLSSRAAGADAQSVARMLHSERRALGVQYKDLTPADELARITERNIKTYNDPLGPSVDWLRSHGKTWEQIIESASRPGGKDLGY